METKQEDNMMNNVIDFADFKAKKSKATEDTKADNEKQLLNLYPGADIEIIKVSENLTGDET